MNRFLLILICVALGVGASRAETFNPAARIAMQSDTERSRASERYIPMILTVDESFDAESVGIIVLNSRADMVLALVPESVLSSAPRRAGITRASAAPAARRYLDKAIAVTHVADVHKGLTDGTLPYDGSGVIVGLSDIGFDPGHATFDGRIAAISNYVETEGIVTGTLTGSAVSSFGTDNPAEYHATHVAGILGGDGDGSPYTGVATGSTIFCSTSQLSDVGILAGVEDIIAYAREQGQPAVINLSVGSTIGPHDGTDAFTRYLDMCAAEVPILLSAGNDGITPVNVSHTFSEAQPAVTAMISDRIDWSYMRLTGYCDMWASDSRAVDITIKVYDADLGSFVYTTAITDEKPAIDTKTDVALAQYFAGRIATASEINPDNDRYNTLMYIDMRATAHRASGPWARYYLCVEMRGQPGSRVDFTADGGGLGLEALGGMSGMVTSGDSHLSISSMACGHNTITVGASATRDTASLLDGSTISWQNQVKAGAMASFSSYGPTFDGRTLPHFSAPGAFIVSAVSSHYVEKYGAANLPLIDQGSTPGNYFIGECGTSMASPHAAGVFALWLQADPTLTPAELLEIATSTASVNGVDLADPRTGAGQIDAAAGLKAVLDNLGITDIDADTTTGEPIYYDLQGRPTATPTAPGIYLRRQGPTTTKIAIR